MRFSFCYEFSLVRIIHQLVGRTEQTPFLPELRSLCRDRIVYILSY